MTWKETAKSLGARATAMGMELNKPSTVEQRYRLRLGVLSLIAAIATIGLKFQAYYLTGSIGLFSDAVESTANLVAALSALFALWYAARPADQTHHYGHEKIEYFASGIEGGLIVFAAGVIAWFGWVAAWSPSCWRPTGSTCLRMCGPLAWNDHVAKTQSPRSSS